MAKFKLVNANGSVLDLSYGNDICLYEVGGLGFDTSNTYVSINTNFEKIDDYLDQKEVYGKLWFRRKYSKAKYTEFVKFIRRTPLTLYYTSSDTYRLSCEVKSITKDDHVQYGNVHDITFIGLGVWYKKVSIINDNTETETGKTYSYDYSYTYSGKTAQVIEIESDSDLDCPCKIKIYGEADNPRWHHYLDGELIETGEYSGTVSDGNYLLIDNTTNVPSIIEYDSYDTVVSNRYQSCDFDTERFFYLKRGTNKIVVAHSSTSYVKIAVEAWLLYESV